MEVGNVKSIRCPKCCSVIGKEEEGKLILRTGYGKRQVFHVLGLNGVLTCWNCKEIITIGGNSERFTQEGGSLKPVSVNR